MQERRLTSRLIGHWQALRDGQAIPPVEKFTTKGVEDLWENCFRLHNTGAGETPFLIEYMGSRIVQEYGRDLTGSQAGDAMSRFPGAQVMKRLQHMLANPSALSEEGSFENESGKVLKFRSCLLPFGADGKITHVIAGVSWKEF